ncbi:MAG: hypothetical protein ACR2LK_04395 [Solirubrobacteraceae bacterium]
MADSNIDVGREALLHALTDADVAFVLIGGAALQSHGQPHRTDDIDITPERSTQNLDRLARVLNALDCRLVIDPADPTGDVRLPSGYFTSAALSRQDIWNLMTTDGKLDITFQPAGFARGFDQLSERAEARQVALTSITVKVAALDDVEHSKRTADRPKDRAYLARAGRLRPPRDA